MKRAHIVTLVGGLVVLFVGSIGVSLYKDLFKPYYDVNILVDALNVLQQLQASRTANDCREVHAEVHVVHTEVAPLVAGRLHVVGTTESPVEVKRFDCPGVVIFLNGDEVVQLRVSPPFSGSLHGVHLGSSRRPSKATRY